MKSITIDRTKRLKEEPHLGHNRWHPDIPPIEEVDLGEEVVLEARDASDCQIKPGARITNSVLGPGCFVEERAIVENSVIWPHTRIGTAAEIRSAIVGRGCHVGRSAIISPGTVLGDKTSLTDYTITGGSS